MNNYMSSMYHYRLRFKLLHHENVTAEHREKWNEFKVMCEWGSNKEILKKTRMNCENESNALLSIVDGPCGGLGRSRDKNKTMRFRDWKDASEEDDIVLLIKDARFTGDDGLIEKWDLREIDDVLRAFDETAHSYVDKRPTRYYSVIEGTIELEINYC